MKRIQAVVTALLLTHNCFASQQHPHNTILFIWDGLRPDSINSKDTPNLYHLKQTGSYFSDNHSSYPTLTMVNAASFATGDLAGKTGFYGNVIWDPSAQGDNAEGARVNFRRPVFTEDYKVLMDLNQPQAKGPLFGVNHLFAYLHKRGIRTASVGKSGPAAIQTNLTNHTPLNVTLDEKHVYPLKFAHWMQAHHFSLPKDSPYGFKVGTLTLSAQNGDPTAFAKTSVLRSISGKSLGLKTTFRYPDRVTTNPADTAISPYAQANRYLMRSYIKAVVPYENPQLSIVWLRNPDSTEHNYGVGPKPYVTAIRAQDKLLGELLHFLKKQQRLDSTNIIVASDHSHSNVSGNLNEFPLRGITNKQVSQLNPLGYSVSGDFRPADLLRRAGFNAYDGFGCQYDPVLSGIRKNGARVYTIKRDTTGKICHNHISLNDLYGHRSQKLKKQLYTTGDFRLPKPLPADAIVVAGNGGSTYFYIPSHNPVITHRLVRFIQSREEFGPVFVHQRYHRIAGALPLNLIKLYNPRGKNPDVIASSHYDNSAVIQGFSGTEYNSAGINRGMHGSFSHTDIHNTLIASGPDFKRHFIDPLPTANVDVPNTIAYLFGAKIHQSDGRILFEALKDGKPLSHYRVQYQQIRPKHAAKHLTIRRTTDPNGRDIDASKSHYTQQLNLKRLILDDKTTLYFDSAKEKRY